MSKVFTLCGAKCGICDSLCLSPVHLSDAKRVLSPVPSIDCAKFCHPTKSWSFYESNFPAQTWNFATNKSVSFWRRHWLPFKCSSRKSGCGFKLRQDGSWVCWYHWYQAGRTGNLRSQELGDLFPQNCNCLCYSGLWVCCFILINKGTVKVKGSDGESKLSSVKENNQSWAGGTSGHRRRRELQKQTGLNQSLPATKMAKVNKAQSVRLPQQYAKGKGSLMDIIM